MSRVVNPESSVSAESVEGENARRVDPVIKHLSYSYDGSVQDGDPSKVYVWVSPALKDLGVPYYRGLGYDVEPYRSGAESGQPITWHEHVLMSAPRERIQSNTENGAAGGLGTNAFGKIISGIVGGKLSAPRGVQMTSEDGIEYFSLKNNSSDMLENFDG